MYMHVHVQITEAQCCLVELQFLVLQEATHATLHDVHPQAAVASVAVQCVNKHVVLAHPVGTLLSIRDKSGESAGLSIMCCVRDTNSTGLEYFALKRFLRTISVDRFYVPATTYR